jgi:hypothetical protein
LKARTPKPATLRKYGLTANEWRVILKRQGGGCAVCGLVPKSGRLCTDHEHVKGWKKMKPEQRKQYVRGILCFFCNHYYVSRAITVVKARNVLKYLSDYESRKSR